jgi:hypothetical protein
MGLVWLTSYLVEKRLVLGRCYYIGILIKSRLSMHGQRSAALLQIEQYIHA